MNLYWVPAMHDCRQRLPSGICGSLVTSLSDALSKTAAPVILEVQENSIWANVANVQHSSWALGGVT